MGARQPSPLDEVHGAAAAGAVLVADLDGAVDALQRTSVRYRLGFLLRLGLVVPSVSLRLAFRLVRRGLQGSRR